MPAKARTLSDDDLRILQGIIDREKRQIVNSPPMHVTERWDSGEDHQAPETYVAYPKTSAGIPARSGDEPGEAECDIYAIYGSPPTLVAVGRSQTVYNLQTSVLDQVYIPISRDKYGKWLVLVGGGGGGGGLIRFAIDYVDCNDHSALAIVQSVPCDNPFDVEVGDTIKVYDKAGCWFDTQSIFLQDAQGFATYNRNAEYGSEGSAYEEECVWEVVSLCSMINACDPLE